MPITKDGIQIRRWEEILADLKSNIQEAVPSLSNLDDDTVAGKIVSKIAIAIAKAEELGLDVYSSMDINQAEGVSLDYLGTLRNIPRQQAAYSSTTKQKIVAKEGVVIPDGSKIKSKVKEETFSIVGDVNVSSGSCVAALLKVIAVADSTAYTVTVNTTSYSFTSGTGATEQSIVDGIVSVINADTAATWQASNVNNMLFIATSQESTISVTSSSFTIEEVEAYANAVADTVGPIIATANTVTEIISGIFGWISTTNVQDYSVGRFVEEDVDYRNRILSTEQLANVGTKPAIKSRISNIQGVSSVLVEENATNATDSFGRPPNSLEIVVQGGDDADVGSEVANTVAAGIQLVGNTTWVGVDANNDPVTVKFTRPVAVNVAVRVTYTLYSEEQPSNNLDSAIKEVVKTHIDSLGIGVDVIPQRMFGGIYSNTSGIDSLTVEVQQLTTSGDTPVSGSWSTTRLPISNLEYSSIEFVDIYVVAA